MWAGICNRKNLPLLAAGLRPQWLIFGNSKCPPLVCSVSSMCFWDQSKPCQSCSNNIFDLDIFESFECLASPSNLALWSPPQKAPAVQKGGKESQNLDVSESVHLKHIHTQGMFADDSKPSGCQLRWSALQLGVHQ